MVGQYLRALGCDVIRLESRDHLDAVRQLPAPRDCGRKLAEATAADNPYFAQLNAGKRSIELDLSTEVGLKSALDLTATCDVVLENLSPGAIDRLGLSYAQIARRRPDVCMLSMPTLHPADPRASLRGYAPVFTGLGGLEIEVGYPDEVTGMLMTGWGDPAGGMTGLLGLLAALHRRERTGLGSYVLVSQLKAVTWQLVRPFAAWRGDLVSATADVRVLQAADAEWVALLVPPEGVNLPAGDSLESWLASQAAAAAVSQLRDAGHDAALVQRIESASDSPRLRDRGVVTEVEEGPMLGWHRYHVPWVRDGQVPRVQGLPPALGEHTHEVLRESSGSPATTV